MSAPLGEEMWTPDDAHQSAVRTLADSAERLVAGLYQAVTFDSGTMPAWENVKAMFHKNAVIVLRTSKDSMTVFSLEGFVKDFVDFIDRFHAEKTGFTERVLRMKPLVFGDIAHVLVLYEASIPGSSRPPQKGVDSFQLIRQGGRWWIVSIVNELPLNKYPIPAELLE